MIKIAVLGPESTGKTILTQQLANHYNTYWEPEYARSYVEHLDRKYDYEDVCKIANYQIKKELEYAQKNDNSLIFFDTELIITKVWFEYCYHTIPDFLTQHLESNYMNFYLLCYPDLPWQADTVREHGTDREFFFDWYQKEIELTGTPYHVVKGMNKQRLQNAITAINLYIQEQR